MTMLSFSRRLILPCSSYPHILGSLGFSSEAIRPLQRDCELSTLRSHDDSSKLNIELVDSNLWPASFILSHSLNGKTTRQENTLNLDEYTCDDGHFNGSIVEDSLDFDEIDNLRIEKKLVYKLDRGSKEYEETDVNFHRKKTLKKRLEKQKNIELAKGCNNFEKSSTKSSPQDTMTVTIDRKHSLSKAIVCEMWNETNSLKDKRARTPTFNQLTDPYHLPFCLDIFVTKGSVRASVIHRVSSRVVTVAHSISKDMKFDLTHKKDATACAAVGEILAQRAIEDDIHNVVYTPRKGDKIEGKLQIVLQSIIDHGVNVKVKLKQKKPVKPWSSSMHIQRLQRYLTAQTTLFLHPKFISRGEKAGHGFSV